MDIVTPIETNKDRRNPQPNILLSIQYLRAIAAILVIFHHARNPLPWLYNPISDFNFGSHGVDIFFVMSGFIMFDAARNEPPPDFVRKRIVRIMPLYWAATLFWLTYQFVLWHQKVNRVLVTDLAKSLLFIPYYDGTGHIWPFLTPGWTLNYEMFFYALFGIGLAIRRVVPFVTLAVIGLCIAGVIFPAHDPRWLTYTNPIMIEFVAGIFLAQAYQRYSFRGLGFCLPLGFAILCTSDILKFPGIPIVGISAVMIIAGALSLEKSGSVPRIASLRLLGNASYAIYLFHIPVVATAELLVRAYVPDVGLLPLIMIVLISIIGGVVGGIFAHLWIEKPLLARLRRRSPTK